LEDGKIARLCPGPVTIIDEVSVGVMHVDGKLIVDGVDGPAKQRRKLSHVGIIFAQVLVDDHFQLAEDIEVLLDGVPLGLEEELAIAAEKAFESMPKGRRKDDNLVEDVVRNGIRRAADMAWGKKPVVKVVVARV
jgi:ribonuclease J